MEGTHAQKSLLHLVATMSVSVGHYGMQYIYGI